MISLFTIFSWRINLSVSIMSPINENGIHLWTSMPFVSSFAVETPSSKTWNLFSNFFFFFFFFKDIIAMHVDVLLINCSDDFGGHGWTCWCWKTILKVIGFCKCILTSLSLLASTMTCMREIHSLLNENADGLYPSCYILLSDFNSRSTLIPRSQWRTLQNQFKSYAFSVW